MYMTLRRDKKLLCDVDIYTQKHDEVRTPGPKNWSIEIGSYIDIKNFAETLLKIPDTFDLARKEFILDFIKIQGLKQDYKEEISKRFPKPVWYELEDPKFNEDKFRIINIIRDQMREIAVKWGLTYGED